MKTNNQKFKKGDLIIVAGKFYYARVVGDTETSFDHIEINGFRESSVMIGGIAYGGSERSIIIGPPDSCATGRCASKKFNEKTGRIEEEQTSGIYPVIGHYSGTSNPMLDLVKLTTYYPELALRYANCTINYANRKLDERIPQSPGPVTDIVKGEMTVPGSGFRTPRYHETPQGGQHIVRPTVGDVQNIMKAESAKDLKNMIRKSPPRKTAKKAAKKSTKKTARKR